MVETYRAWIPHGAQEIEERVTFVKTIIKLMEFAEEIKLIKSVPKRQIH